MQEFIKELEQLQNWKHLLREACKRNRICTSAAEEMTPKKIKTLSEWFTKVHKAKPLFDSWTQHEKGAFNWVLIAYSAMKNVLIEDFREQEWRTLYKIFENKSQNFLRYETRRYLFEKTPKNKHWTKAEEQLLLQLIKENQQEKVQDKSKWYRIARKLFQRSQELYFRSAKHCRERWSNYLDPSKVRGQWTAAQELSLMQKVEQKGKKWADLAQQLNRNEHCVKNKYNSIISHQRKISPSLRKQQKILAEAKKRLQKVTIPQLIPQIVVQPDPTIVRQALIVKHESKIKFKFKNSSQSLFDDNRSFVNYNNQFQNKNRLDFPYVEGEQYVKHLLKEEEQPHKNQNYNQNFIWSISSPQILTPFGLTPSPIPLNYQFNNFNKLMQIWGKTQKTEQFK